MLSPTRGILSQIFFIEVNIRAFLFVAIRGRTVTGPNSATGSPRLSITITLPSPASRTNCEVRRWSSRTDVVFMCYVVAQLWER